MNYPIRIEAGSGGRSPDGGARFRTRGRWRRPGRNIKDDVDDLPYCHSLPMQDRSRFIPRFARPTHRARPERCGDFGKTAKRNNQVFSNEINEVCPAGPTRAVLADQTRPWPARHLAKQTHLRPVLPFGETNPPWPVLPFGETNPPAAGRALDFCKTNYVFQMKSMSAVHDPVRTVAWRCGSGRPDGSDR